MKKQNKGFTIVELVIVIAVIAILAAVLIPTFSNIIKKAQQSSDTQLIRNLNGALAIDLAEKEENSHATCYDAFQAAEEAGYNVARIVSKSGYNIAWDKVSGHFVLLNEQENTVLYPVDEQTNEVTKLTNDADKVNYFVVRTNVSNDVYDAPVNYSLYCGLNFNAKTVNLSGVGFDAGNATTITNVNYNNTQNSKIVIIRTNSVSTNLTVNAPLDHVSHYGVAGIVNLQSVATTSYFEFGATVFVELAKGRIVLTESSDVEVINVSKKNNNTYNNPIIADAGVKEENMPELICRDQVEVNGEKTELVQIQKTDKDGNVQGTVEQVYAYASENVGSTVKTETQNTNVSSTIGNIVLDSTDKAGEKAYSETTKEEKANEVVQEKMDEEVTSKDADKEYVARIGLKGYETLAAAFKAATTEGQTIYMLNDSAESGLGAKVSNITLNMNGYSLTNTSGNTINQWTSKASLNIVGSSDSVIFGDVRVYTSVTFTENFNGKLNGNIIKEGGTLSIKGGTYSKLISIKKTSYKQATYQLNDFISIGYTTEAVDENNVKIVPVTAENAVVSATVEGNTNYYMSLKDAQNYAVNGGTIKLLQDFTYVNSNIVANYYPTSNVTIDLNGHTLNMGNYTNGIMIYSGTLTILDSIGTGNIISNNNCKPFKVYYTSNLTITNINHSDKITLVDCDSTATGNIKLNNIVTNNGFSTRCTVIYNNCTINSQITVFSGTAIVNGGKYEQITIYNGASATINSGTFGYINNSGTLDIVNCIIDSNIIDSDTALYCVGNVLTGYTCTNNGDGTWTVTTK